MNLQVFFRNDLHLSISINVSEVSPTFPPQGMFTLMFTNLAINHQSHEIPVFKSCEVSIKSAGFPIVSYISFPGFKGGLPHLSTDFPAKIPPQVWQKHLAKRFGSAVSCWRQKFGMTRLVNFAKFRDVCCNWDRSIF